LRALADDRPHDAGEGPHGRTGALPRVGASLGGRPPLPVLPPHLAEFHLAALGTASDRCGTDLLRSRHLPLVLGLLRAGRVEGILLPGRLAAPVLSPPLRGLPRVGEHSRRRNLRGPSHLHGRDQLLVDAVLPVARHPRPGHRNLARVRRDRPAHEFASRLMRLSVPSWCRPGRPISRHCRRAGVLSQGSFPGSSYSRTVTTSEMRRNATAANARAGNTNASGDPERRPLLGGWDGRAASAMLTKNAARRKRKGSHNPKASRNRVPTTPSRQRSIGRVIVDPRRFDGGEGDTTLDVSGPGAGDGTGVGSRVAVGAPPVLR